MTFSFMNIHPRNEATWLPGIFLPQNFWLCSLFVHLDSRKTLQLFPSSIYWFLLWMEMALEDLHIYQSFSNQNTYTYACMHKKVFLALISLHLLYIKLKLESFLLFYAYIECTSIHRMKNLCWKAISYSRTKDSIFFEAT